MGSDYELVPIDEFDALLVDTPTTRTSKSSSPLRELGKAKEARQKPSFPLFSSNDPAEERRFLQWLHADLGKFPAKTHARKVATELGVPSGMIYLLGQEDTLYEDSDQGPKFRQRRYFYYLTGADHAGCAVTYDITRDRLILWIPYTDPRKVLWYGRGPSIEACKDASDVDDVRYIAGLPRYLNNSLDPGATLYVLHPEQAPQFDRTKGTVVIDSVKLQAAMDRARVIKTQYEIEMIRRANAVSSAAHKLVQSRLSCLQNEREIDAIFRGYCIAHGAPTQAYPVIAAAGPAASTLHYEENDQPLPGKQLVVLDAGAEWKCYASDITRTLPLTVSGNGLGFTKEAEEIYTLVLKMQRECIDLVAPGVDFAAIHLHACRVALKGLMDLNILGRPGVSFDEIWHRGTVAAFFPHGLGHHVGLEVHDVSGDQRLLMLPEYVSSVPFPAAGPSRAAIWESCGVLIGAGVLNRRRSGVGRKRQCVTAEMLATLVRTYDAPSTTLRTKYGAGSEKIQQGPSSDPTKRKGQILQGNMIVTIEPGIYFCREYITAYFLNDALHGGYINKEVLARYWDVGGVRIEDDILVTEDGWENLTNVPKEVGELLAAVNGL